MIRPHKKPLSIRLALLLVMIGLAGWISPARAQTPTPGQPVYIYLFWGEGCPHCAKAKPYFEELTNRYPGVVLKSFEVYYNQDNQQFFISMAERYGLDQLAVPTIFIGSYKLQGYAERMNWDIENVVVNCLQNGCVDAAEGLAGIPEAGVFPSSTPTTSLPTASLPIQEADTALPDFSLHLTPVSTSLPLPVTSTPTPEVLSSAASRSSTAPLAVVSSLEDAPGSTPTLNSANVLDIPLLGSVDLEMQSITLSTALIAFVDGFNPCSLWVLSMLLALTLHTGSRKKVLAIGLIFLTVTAGIYALFIAGLFSVLKVASFLGWIQILVALVALFFALVNVKDYFWYKEGISFTIADDKKSGIFKRMRAVMDASQSLWGLASATVVLAVGVSMVEFSCTAGFPVIWVNLLSAQQVGGAVFLLLLLLYMLIYQLDEMIIFLSAVISLKASRVEEKQGRLLKLVGGMLMLALAIVMLVNPALMNSLGSSLLIFGGAFLATLFVLFLHRILLPALGVRIGSEFGERHKPVRNITE